MLTFEFPDLIEVTSDLKIQDMKPEESDLKSESFSQDRAIVKAKGTFSVNILPGRSTRIRAFFNAQEYLFICRGQQFFVEFAQSGWESEKLWIRACLVYLDSSHSIERCVKHRTMLEYGGQHTMITDQTLREVVYEKRFIPYDEHFQHITKVPIQDPVKTVPYQFTCFNSCFTGKRPMAIEFILENEDTKTLSTAMIRVRICSFPLRDARKHLKRKHNENVNSVLSLEEQKVSI